MSEIQEPSKKGFWGRYVYRDKNLNVAAIEAKFKTHKIIEPSTETVNSDLIESKGVSEAEIPLTEPKTDLGAYNQQVGVAEKKRGILAFFRQAKKNGAALPCILLSILLLIVKAFFNFFFHNLLYRISVSVMICIIAIWALGKLFPIYWRSREMKEGGVILDLDAVKQIKENGAWPYYIWLCAFLGFGSIIFKVFIANYVYWLCGLSLLGIASIWFAGRVSPIYWRYRGEELDIAKSVSYTKESSPFRKYVYIVPMVFLLYLINMQYQGQLDANQRKFIENTLASDAKLRIKEIIADEWSWTQADAETLRPKFTEDAFVSLEFDHGKKDQHIFFNGFDRVAIYYKNGEINENQYYKDIIDQAYLDKGVVKGVEGEVHVSQDLERACVLTLNKSRNGSKESNYKWESDFAQIWRFERHSDRWLIKQFSGGISPQNAHNDLEAVLDVLDDANAWMKFDKWQRDNKQRQDDMHCDKYKLTRW